RNEIIRPEQALQASRHLPEYFIPNRVAKCFIDILEPVDIHECHGKSFFLLHGILYCDVKQVIQSCTIRQTGERVMLGKKINLRFMLLEPGNIRQQHDMPGQPLHSSAMGNYPLQQRSPLSIYLERYFTEAHVGDTLRKREMPTFLTRHLDIALSDTVLLGSIVQQQKGFVDTNDDAIVINHRQRIGCRRINRRRQCLLLAVLETIKGKPEDTHKIAVEVAP